MDLLGIILSSNNEPPEPPEPPGPPQVPPATAATGSLDDYNDDNGVDDSQIIESCIELSKLHVSIYICIYIYYTNHQSFSVKCVYPDEVDELGLTQLIQEFINEQHHPNSSASNILNLPPFYEKITIHMSTVTTFHAPSDLSGVGSMKCECIHAVNCWRNSPGHYDTMFINTTHSNMDDDANPSSVHGFPDLEVAQVHLFFSFVHEGVKYPCTLVHWFSCPSDVPSDIMGMYTLEPDHNHNSQPVTAVIHLDTVFRAAHLLPISIDPASPVIQTLQLVHFSCTPEQATTRVLITEI